MGDSAGPDDRPVERALRELLGPMDRHLERGRSVLAAALVLTPAPFILLWLLSRMEGKHAAGWAVLAFGALVLAGLGWEGLMGRYVRWRFDRRFPRGTAERETALVILAEIETPNKVEEKVRDAVAREGSGIVRHRAGPGASLPSEPLLELPPLTPQPTPPAEPFSPPPAAPRRRLLRLHPPRAAAAEEKPDGRKAGE